MAASVAARNLMSPSIHATPAARSLASSMTTATPAARNLVFRLIDATPVAMNPLTPVITAAPAAAFMRDDLVTRGALSLLFQLTEVGGTLSPREAIYLEAEHDVDLRLI